MSDAVDREETIRALTSLRERDAVILAGEAVASFVPGVGGVVALALEQVRQRRDRRVAEFIVDLAEALQTLTERVDRDFVRSAEYANLLERSLDEVARARQSAKRAHYAAAMARAACVQRPADDEMALFMDTLDELLPVHLRLLAGISSGPKDVSAPNEYFTVGTAAWAAITAALPGMDTAVIQRCWEDLAAHGLVESLVNVTADVRTATALPHAITAFGLRFLRFIEAPEPSWDTQAGNV